MSGRLSRGFINYAGAAPRNVRRASILTLAWAGVTLLTAFILLSQRSYVYDQLIKTNNKAKNPTANYTGNVVNHDVDKVFWGGLVTSAITVLILLLLSHMLLRGRGVARWSLIALATIVPIIVPSLGIGLLAQLAQGIGATDASPVYRIPLIVGGLCALAVVVLLLTPESSRYFAANRPQRAAAPARGRPTLFPRRPMADRPGTIDVEPSAVEVTPSTTAPSRPSGKGTARRPGSVKAKSGSDRSQPGRTKSRNQ